MEKMCTRCLATMPISNFAKNATRADGHQSWCRSCLKGWRVTRIAKMNGAPTADSTWAEWVSHHNGNLKAASAARKEAIAAAV